MLRRLPIRLKLVLLAGVPVLGALMLATLLARDAQRNARSAAALGSIEDLARLSAQMSKLVHQLQFERSELGLRLGLKTPNAPQLAARFESTDTSTRELNAFLARRQVTTLPARLARDLSAAREQLLHLQEERQAALSGKHNFALWFERYAAANRSLVSATAALAQLSDDGELMRAISALVSTMEIKERASQEQALLSYVFAADEFPPGTFKQLVTLSTEEANFVRVLEVNASDPVIKRFRSLSSGPEQVRATELLQLALNAVEDQFDVDPSEWNAVQGRQVERLRSLEVELNEAVKAAALTKVATAQKALSISYSLGGSVIVLSALLAAWIALGVSRSVGSLVRATERVRTAKDFTVRAVKTSDDELGRLTDAFNDMLTGIEARDHELAQHRDHLEGLVASRTTELSQRNHAMRIVLDNVEQGLATIEPSGRLSRERSRAFDAWFGAGSPEDRMAERLAQGDATLQTWLTRGWDQVTEGILPPEAAVDQLPRKIQSRGRHYQLGYRIISDGGELQGVLLVVSDVTAEMERLARDAEQRELIGTFEHLMSDRGGAVEFFEECQRLIDVVLNDGGRERALVLRALHTLKGNTLTFGVTSVASAAHQLEGRLIDGPAQPTTEREALARAWQAFSERMGRLLGTHAEPIVEVTLPELEALKRAVRAGVPTAQVSKMLERLALERASVRVRRIGDQARSLAQRLGKGSVRVDESDHGDVRFERQRWAAFWGAFMHAIRNALDHGIETEAERLRADKPAHGRLGISVRGDATSITVELSDDGRGIDYEKVRSKAAALGLAHETQAQLVDALFHDGFTTSATTTELSGRGVGLSALREAASGLGGVISLHSRVGLGTTLSVRFPAS